VSTARHPIATVGRLAVRQPGERCRKDALGVARILSGDPDGADAYLVNAASGAGLVGAYETRSEALSERSLLAMAHGDWSQVEALAGQAGAALGQIASVG
jgi:hypothetical protein